jgi:hypothetical protein
MRDDIPVVSFPVGFTGVSLVGLINLIPHESPTLHPGEGPCPTIPLGANQNYLYLIIS